MNTENTTDIPPSEPKSYRLTATRLISIACIFAGVSVAWFILGGAMTQRTEQTSKRLNQTVDQVWGAPLMQTHPTAWVDSPKAWQDREFVRTSSSDIDVQIRYEARRKGLFLYRTYEADFAARYTIPNPTPIDQTVYVAFPMPSGDTSFVNFSFRYGGEEAQDVVPVNGMIERAIVIPAGESVPLEVTYRARGTDRWDYDLSNCDRLRNFRLTMSTDFEDVDFPDGGNSPTDRSQAGRGWQFIWDYPDVIGAQSIAMDMPKVLNAGPVAARISFFAPVSLLFFFSVLLILGVSKGIGLHPVHYFFLGAGCFAFQLLFAYMVDLIPITAAFIVAALASLFLVSGYIRAVAGPSLARIALPAQLIYMTLFSYSFFFDGISGLTIAIGSVVTLAVLMKATARTNWEEVFSLRHQLKRAVSKA